MTCVIRPYFVPHGRRFNVVQGVLCRDKHFPITDWFVPELGAQNLHASLATDTMSYDGKKAIGVGNHLMYRAREKLDGEEIVVFGVEAGGIRSFYMWDVDNIYPVLASGPARFERVGDKIYLLSDIPDYQLNMPFERHSWELLSTELVDKSVEGVILNIDADEYKVVREPTVTLKVVDNQAFTANHEKICDVISDDGLYDFDVETNVVVRERKDRVFPDSAQALDVIRRCVVKYDDLDKYFHMNHDRRVFKDVRINVDPLSKFMEVMNNGAIKVPHLCVRLNDKPEKPVNTKISLIRRSLPNDPSFSNGSVTLSKDIIERLCVKHGYVKDGMLYNLGYWQPSSIVQWGLQGIDNNPFKGCCCVVVDDIPDRFKPFFCYKGLYIVYYDPKLWMIAES